MILDRPQHASGSLSIALYAMLVALAVAGAGAQYDGAGDVPRFMCRPIS